MGFFKKLGNWGAKAARGASAVYTLGLSEAYRKGNKGKADPYTGYMENLYKGTSNKLGSAFGEGSGTPGVNMDETNSERRQRGAQESDVILARQYRDRLQHEADAGPRAAPMVKAPGPIVAAHAGGPTMIGAPTRIAAERVGSTFDKSGQQVNADAQAAYMDRLRSVETGTAGPSAAELQMKRGSAGAVSQAYAMTGGHKGYSGAGLRNAQRVGASLQQQNIVDTGIQRANEISDARQQYGQAVTAARGQDIGLAQVDADLALRAAQSNQGAALTAEQQNAQNQIEVARANQAAKMQTDLTNAGFDQQAIMAMSDNELKVRLANAGFQLSQEQIDDLRLHNQRSQQLEAQEQILNASAGQASREAQIKQARAQYALAVQQNDQKAQAAALAMLTELGAAYATGGASAAAGSMSRGAVGPAADGSDDTMAVKI